jgi:hypothetical protein
MHAGAGAVAKPHGSRLGQMSGVDGQLARHRERLDRAASRIEGDDRARAVRAARAEHRAIPLDAETRQNRVGQVEGARDGRRPIDPTEMPATVLGEARHDLMRAEKAVPTAAERPGRAGKFGRHRADRLDPAIRDAIDVPPARPVRDEVQHAVGGPGRLDDGFALAPADRSRLP